MSSFSLSWMLAWMLTALAVPVLTGCAADDPPVAVSPDGSLSIALQLEDGQPAYHVVADGDTLVASSALGLRLKEDDAPLGPFEATSMSTERHRETWTPVWGTDSTVVNDYREVTLRLRETSAPNRELEIVARAYDDGVAFRYRVPEQPNLDSFVIMNEGTQFRFADDHDAWWIPGNPDSYERIYQETPLSRIAALDSVDAGGNGGFADFAFPHSVSTPITLRSPARDRWLSVHEAALTDYAGMKLTATGGTTLESRLVPWPNGDKVRASAPHASPWRTLQVADRPGALIESHLIQNLNDPSRIDDPSWIEPMTYVGIWWGMHIGAYSWAYADDNHGATTERTKRYMDFAAEHNIDAVLVEGWNTGWERWGAADAFSFTESYPDFDLAEVVAYGQERGVKLIGHHETGGDVPSYERQMDDAFALYDSLGVGSVKTGYAGPIRPQPMYHHGQRMVNHYRDVVELAAEHQIMINAHEPIKPTGIARTWPNMVTREGVRGMEYNAWSAGNPPAHAVTLPFTRMLAGPLDYTPGIFDLLFADERPDRRVRTTLAKQLANEVILYSPLQMAADRIENYEAHEAFGFIERLPTDWAESHVLNAQIGDYVTIARREKGGPQWFVGAATNEEARTVSIPLDVLDDGRDYVAHVYGDVPGQDYATNPTDYRVRRGLVAATDTIAADLGRSGGIAIRLEPAGPADRTAYDRLRE